MGENDWLKEVFEYHDSWVEMARLLGGGSRSEDLVQDAYMKLAKYSSREKVFKGDDISKGYMFFTIRSVVATYHNNKMNSADYMPDNVVKDFKDESDMDFEHSWGRFCDKIEVISDDWHWTDKKIFDRYRYNKNSMRQIARDFGISWITVFNAVKRCKIDIKDKLNGAYQSTKKKV